MFNESDHPRAEDGRFGEGGGKHSGPTEADKTKAKEHVDEAKKAGMDVKIGKGAPSNPKETKALAKAAKDGKHAVAVTSKPKVETMKRGDVVTHRFGDNQEGMDLSNPHHVPIQAKTYPDPSPKRQGRWVSHQQNVDGGVSKTSCKSRGVALAKSKAFMRDWQNELTSQDFKSGKSVEKTVKTVLDGWENKARAGKEYSVQLKVLTAKTGGDTGKAMVLDGNAVDMVLGPYGRWDSDWMLKYGYNPNQPRDDRGRFGGGGGAVAGPATATGEKPVRIDRRRGRPRGRPSPRKTNRPSVTRRNSRENASETRPSGKG